MEAVEKKNGYSVRILRRFLAILLTGLAILSLFWPSVLAVGGTMRKDLKVAIEEMEDEIEQYRAYYGANDKEIEKEIASEVSGYILGYCRMNAQNAGQAGNQEMSNFWNNAFSILNTLNHNVPVSISTDLYTTIYRSVKNLGFSYEEFREIIVQLPYFAEKAQDMIPQLRSDAEPYVTAIKYGNVGYNVLFFLVIALAAAAIVLMFMNRSKFWVILFTIFAVIFAGIFIALWILMLTNGVRLFIPGVSMFALPVLAIAACIVYKRDKRYKGIFPKREKKEIETARVETPVQPAFEAYAPVAAPVFTPVKEAEPVFAPAEPVKEEPVFAPEEPAAEEPVFVPVAPEAEEPVREAVEADEEGWICRECGERNDADAKFCTYCGTKKAEAPVCPNCGAPVREGVKFCTLCGTKLN
jgi:ribosomal protein L40E